MSRSSICQHPPEGWQSRLGPGDRHQTWDAGLGSPNVCARIGAGLLQDKEKGLPAMTNGYLRINRRRGGEGGRRKSAESLFHHPSVSFGPLINLWTLHLPLFQCRTPFSIHCLLWPLCNKFNWAKCFTLFFKFNYALNTVQRSDNVWIWSTMHARPVVVGKTEW